MKKYFLVRAGRVRYAANIGRDVRFDPVIFSPVPSDVIYEDCSTPTEDFCCLHSLQHACEVEQYRAASDGPDDPPRWAEISLYQPDEFGSYMPLQRPMEPMRARAVARWHMRNDGLYRRTKNGWVKA